MKLALVLVEGLADRPHHDLEDQTPLARAATPHLDRLASTGMVGRAELFRPRAPVGLEGALFALLGGDAGGEPAGRGGFEALVAGEPASGAGRVASARLFTGLDGRLADLGSGDLSDPEARLLVEAVDEALGGPGLRLHHVAGNEALVLLGEADGPLPLTTPPELCLGKPLNNHLPRGAGGERLAALVRASGEILDAHEVNRVRCDLGEDPANLLWIWGVADLPTSRRWLETRTPKGAVISADRWARGLALAFGMEAPGPDAADAAGLGLAAIEALDRFDLVIVHLKEAGRATLAGDVTGKVGAIEALDADVIGPLAAHLESAGGRLVVVSAWTGDTAAGAITPGFGPFLRWDAGEATPGAARHFDEAAAADSPLEVRDSGQLREYIFAAR